MRGSSRRLVGGLAGAGIVPAAVLFALSVVSGRTIQATAASFMAVANNPTNFVGALYVIAPLQNAATSRPGGVVRLTWDASTTITSDPVSYLVFRRPSGGGSYSQIASTAAGVLTYDDTPGTDGQYDYVVQAQVSTFTSVNSNSKTAYADSVAPTTTASLSGTSGTNGWYTSAVTVTLTATDATSGVAATYYAVDNSACSSSNLGACSTYSSPFSVSSDSSSHTVYFLSVDSAGNAESQKASTFKIDATAPGPTSKSVSGGTSGSNGWYTASPTITLSSSDALSGLAGRAYQFVTHGSAAPSNTGGGWTTYSAGFSVPVGDNDLYAYSTDSAGNRETPVSLGEFKLDGTAPSTTASLSGTSGSNGWYTASPVSVTLSASDGTSGVATTYYAIDNSACSSTNVAACSTYSGAFNVTGDANHTVYFFSKDSAGNAESQQTQTVKVDATAPTTTASLSGTSGTNGWYTSAVTVTLTAADATSGVAATYYAVDNSACSSSNLGACSTYSSPFSVSSDSSSHTVYFFSKDSAGNAETRQTTTFKIDATQPAISAVAVCDLSGAIAPVSANWIANNNYKVYANLSDSLSGIAGVTAYTGAAGSGPGTSLGSLTASSGTCAATTYSYTSGTLTGSGLTAGTNNRFINVQATDNAGNVRNSNGSYSGNLSVDLTAPGAPGSISATDGANGSGQITYGWTAPAETSGVAGYSYTVTVHSSGATAASGTLGSGATSYVFMGTSNSHYDFSIIATDNAGNNGTAGTLNNHKAP